VVDSWRRYKRDLTEAQDRPAARWSPLRPKQVSQRDLLIPASRHRLQLLAACLFCGFGLSVLWFYFPMLMLSIAVNHEFGAWKWIATGGFAASLGLTLYLYSAADEQKYWDSLDA
jgi:hypothetical protein